MSSDIKVLKLSVLNDAIDMAMQSEEEKLSSILNNLKISPKEQLQPPQVALQMANRKTEGYSTLGTLGNFSLIIGKAKSRKSFYINIAVATAISKDLVLNLFKTELPQGQNEVLYFDTEQGKYHVQLALKRICKQVNIEEPDNLQVYHLRSKTPAQRLELIEYAIYHNDKIGIVVIDGIKDLITSINDEAEATMIASKLLKWTEERNIHIITVLHQNKSDSNARGHIGSELINKAETVLSITKAETDSTISIVEAQQCRNIEPETFAFEIIDGLPVIAENYELRTETKKNKFDVTELEDYKKFQLLTEVFSKGERFTYSDLVIQLGLAYKKQFKSTIGTNRAKELVTYCKNKNWLQQEANGKPYTLGAFKEEGIL
ncbi:MAG: AAA family ATPase [Flavobacterium sp.]|uniref:AAA family ATPase n=1 Tax=Flavobacterium sp. TaxID=239 RepID=UPI0032637007